MPDINQQISKALQQAIEDKKRNQEFVKSIGPAIVDALKPTLDRIASDSEKNRQAIVQAVKSLKVEVNPQVRVPDIHIPEINVPEMNLPTPIVNYTPPAIKIPDIKMPDEMNIKGWVSLMGVSLEKPLPVQLRDAKGNPVVFPDTSTIISGSGGGGHGIVKVSNVLESAWGQLLTPDGRLKTETASGGGGLTDTELRASAVPVSQVSGAIWSVNVAQQDVSQLVHQVSGSIWSVADGGGSLTVDATDLDIRNLDPSQDGVRVYQVSGEQWSTSATQAGTWNIGTVTTVTAVTDITNSVKSALIDSSGVQYSGSNPVPITGTITVSNSITSVVAEGSVLHDAVDAGNAPVKIGGTAMQTNPTPVADGDIVRAVRDDIGRTLTRPIQVRDLIVTAYASVTNGTETTLLAASAGFFHDLIMLVASNNSDAAVSVDIRAVTAGNIINTLRIPANGTAGFVPAVPWPQDATGNNWTVDGPDETGRTLTFSALFSKEV